jgi:energy-coupling factor transport system permease protein
LKPLHPLTWLIWLVACSALAWATRNPLYLIVLLLCITLVHVALGRAGDGAQLRTTLPLWRIGLLMLPLSAVLNAAWTRVGDVVLLRLPASIPLFGGPITLEALLYGALNGLMLLTLLSAFSAFNRALGARDLLRFVPRGFDALAVTGSIAITYVPFTLRQALAIREAQAVRGLAARGLRDWLPLFLPLLTSGLERAFQLAESLSARGFAATHAAQRQTRLQLILIGGLLLACGGWAAQLFGAQRVWASAAWLGGCMGVATAIWLSGRNSAAQRSTYHAQPMRAADWLLIAALCSVCALAFSMSQPSLLFDPYHGLSAPLFDPLLGSALLLSALPAGVLAR